MKLTVAEEVILLLALCSSLNCMRSTIVSSTSSSVEVVRSAEKEWIVQEGTMKVSLEISVSSDVTAIIVSERLPSEFKINASTPDYTKYDPPSQTWSWLVYSRAGLSNITILYNFDVSSNASDGIYVVDGYWTALGGDKEPFSGETSPTEFMIGKQEGTLSLSASTLEAKEGDTVIVSGSLFPTLLDENITLTYVKPDKSTVEKELKADADGKFVDTCTVDEVGVWTVSARWKGNWQYKEVSSSAVMFTVKSTFEPTRLQWEIYIVFPVILVLAVSVVVFLRRTYSHQTSR